MEHLLINKKVLCMDVIESFLDKLKQAYSAYDVSIIDGMLADNFVYESFFEFHNITNKNEYLKYLSGVLLSMQKVNYIEPMEHLYDAETDRQVLVLTQKRVPPGNEFVCFVAQTDNCGKINKLELTLSSFYKGVYGPKNWVDDLIKDLS